MFKVFQLAIHKTYTRYGTVIKTQTVNGTTPANPDTGLLHGCQWVVLPLATWTGENMEAHVSMAKWQQSVWMCSAVKGTKFDIKHKAAVHS